MLDYTVYEFVCSGKFILIHFEILQHIKVSNNKIQRGQVHAYLLL